MGEQASLEFDLTFGDVLHHKLVQASLELQTLNCAVDSFFEYSENFEL